MKHKNIQRCDPPWSVPESKRYGYWDFAVRNEPPIYPFCVEEISRRGKFRFSESACRFMIVVFVTGGEILYRFGGCSELLTPGRALVIPPGMGYTFETGESGFYDKVILEVMGSLLSPFCGKLGFDRIRAIEIGREQENLTERLLQLGEMLRERKEDKLPESLGITYSILFQLATTAERRANTSNLLHAARLRLESDFNHPLQLNGLASELGVSTATLSRAFREEFQVTPMRYRLEYKLARARYLLLHTELSVKEIAFAVGYCNAFYFSREFRRFYGESPRRLRQRGDSV